MKRRTALAFFLLTELTLSIEARPWGISAPVINRNVCLNVRGGSSSNSEEEEEEASSPLKTTSTTTKKPYTKKSTSTTTKKTSTKTPKLSAAGQAHLHARIPSTNPNYRIQRELKAFVNDPPPNLSVNVGKNLRVWIVTMKGVGIYEGETFKLRVSFPKEYPTVPPSVYFVAPHIPVHEHVYTNGDICLSLLGKGWQPTMTGQSIAVSILSILASAQSKSLPMDNSRHALNKPGQYQKDWVYHDDGC